MKGDEESIMAKETILLVEEDDALLTVLRKTLTRQGFDVVTAQNGLAALTVPDERHVDLVLLDRRLSVMDGAKTAERLRRSSHTYYLPVLLLVPRDLSEGDQSQDLHGADGYMLIPNDTEDIVRKVRNMLEEKETHNQARKLLLERIGKDIDHLVEGVVQNTFQDRAETMLSELSKGLVDLLEGRARDILRRRIDELVDDEFTARVSAMVEDRSRPIVEEVSNEIVTRIASDILDDRSEEMIVRFERQQLPDMAGRAFEKASEKAHLELVERVKEDVKGILVEDLCQNLPSLVEKMVSRAIPPAADKWLPDILQKEVGVRVQQELATKGTELVRKQVLNELRELGRKRLVRLFVFGLVTSILVLSGATAAIIRFAPWWLSRVP